MNETQRQEYKKLLNELDELRQQDNRILFELGNPPELDDQRGEILNAMRLVIGKIQRLEFLMWVGSKLKPPDDPFIPDF